MTNHHTAASPGRRVGAAAETISSLFSTPERYFRSVQLERDFADPTALSQYVLTDAMRGPFERVLEGVTSGSRRRAWRVTGDYGTGKSSFALALAHVLAAPPARSELPSELATLRAMFPNSRPLAPILVTGRRMAFVPAVAHAAKVALQRRTDVGSAGREADQLLRSAAERGDLEALRSGLRNLARALGGVVLVIDELGKFLEYASLNADHEDVFALQVIAEEANSGDEFPVVVVGLLHQGFHAYSSALPMHARLEWEKVAGRYEEITFHQPLSHTMALVEAALGISNPPPRIVQRAVQLAVETSAQGWLPGAPSNDHFAQIYPLHPALVPVLVRFFGRFGQNERSLYTFLLSQEPGGLQEFALQAASEDRWYTVADFYDYVRYAYGYTVGGAGYQSHWSRIVDTLDAHAGLPEQQLRVLKGIAILNLLDAEHLRPSADALRVALATAPWPQALEKVLPELVEQGLVFQRLGGDLRLWPLASINLDDARDEAARALGLPEPATVHLPLLLGQRSVLARRHAIETGTLRHFDLRYVRVVDLSTHRHSFTGDGCVLVVLSETADERAIALDYASRIKDRRILAAVPGCVGGLQAEIHDVRIWQYVREHTAELAHDDYAETEVDRQLMHAQRQLDHRVADLVPGPHSRGADTVWFRMGEVVRLPPRGLTALLSEICRELYSKAPVIRHELLNRHTLSSAGAAARMRLIERMFTHAGVKDLGFDAAKAPPERSMYLSTLQRGGIHSRQRQQYAIRIPDAVNDKLNIRPSIEAMIKLIKKNPDARVSIVALTDALASPPFGVRAGVAVLLVAVLLTAHSDEIAVYEEGTFLHRMDASAFLRLSKAPGTFEVQWAAVTGVRAEVFDLLAAEFASDAPAEERNLLAVVRPLCVFAVRDLNDYVKRCKELPNSSGRVRDVLLSASDPGGMLFRELPTACGIAPFEPNEPTDPSRVNLFIDALRVALDELRACYPALLLRIADALKEQLDLDIADRTAFAERAKNVAQRSARDGAVRSVALRIADHGLLERSWIESIASTVVAKPPSKWVHGDEERFNIELARIATRFRQMDRLQGGSDAESAAYHVGIMDQHGENRVQVVRVAAAREAELDGLVKGLEAQLPPDRALRVATLSRLLWASLHEASEDT